MSKSLDFGDEKVEGIQAAEVHIVDFIESVLWQDMQNELNIWLEHIRDSLEDVNYFEQPDKYKPINVEMRTRLQGAAATIRRVLKLPYVLLENKRDDLMHAQREREEEQEDG